MHALEFSPSALVNIENSFGGTGFEVYGGLKGNIAMIAKKILKDGTCFRISDVIRCTI